MKLWKNKAFWRFLIPSLIGIFLFITPVQFQGEPTIPIAMLAHILKRLIGENFLTVSWILITSSAVVTVLHKILNFRFLRRNAKINETFSVGGFWLAVRLAGCVLINLIYFQCGPAFIIGPRTGALVATDLLPTLACIFFLGGIFLSLLTDYGLLDLLGTYLIKVMRPVFNLPGRSALNCITSWLGDGSLGVMISGRQYEEGFYSRREATVVATTFSAVSITFCLAVVDEVGLKHMFLPFYLAVTVAGIVAALIVPRIPPLSRIPNTYCRETPSQEDIPAGMSTSKYAGKVCLEKAANAPGFAGFLRAGLENVVEMIFGTLPVVLTIGTVALILSEYTPLFQWLGMPFEPLYRLLQIPEAKAASQTVLVGFADMFVPSVIAGKTIASELTRFVVAATSVTQLIYMSEIGCIIMSSKIRIPFYKLFIIFVERTLVTLPVIALFAHLLF